jgi:two-component system chemotaxis response regulator CheB
MTKSIMVVDDSAVVRRTLQTILEKSYSEIFFAADPIFAQRKMKTKWPDIIILDIDMPRMDGLTFLKEIMSTRPTPVIMCSVLATEGSAVIIEALSSGAFSVVTKPKIGVKSFLEGEGGKEVLNAVAAACNANVKNTMSSIIPKIESKNTLKKSEPTITLSEFNSLDQKLSKSKSTFSHLTNDKIIAIGTSTGGTQALEYVLKRLPNDLPGILVVQHMPKQFTKAFADRLNSVCRLEIKEAEDGDRIRAGLVLIAPGGKHLQVVLNGAQYIAKVFNGPPVNRHRPSVDVLFKSVANFAGKNALGVIMTGMGDDGAQGLLEMKNLGANTCAQNEESCVVFGMPKEAIKLNAHNEIKDLSEIPDFIISNS